MPRRAGLGRLAILPLRGSVSHRMDRIDRPAGPEASTRTRPNVVAIVVVRPIPTGPCRVALFGDCERRECVRPGRRNDAIMRRRHGPRAFPSRQHPPTRQRVALTTTTTTTHEGNVSASHSPRHVPVRRVPADATATDPTPAAGNEPRDGSGRLLWVGCRSAAAKSSRPSRHGGDAAGPPPRRRRRNESLVFLQIRSQRKQQWSDRNGHDEPFFFLSSFLFFPRQRRGVKFGVVTRSCQMEPVRHPCHRSLGSMTSGEIPDRPRIQSAGIRIPTKKKNRQS